MSEVRTFLKIGTTAVVLDMIEDGFFDRDYSLQSPVQAIRDISHDPTLKETIKLKDGRSISALQLQQEYLEYAIRYVNTVATDDESRHVVERWTDIIEKLATDPMQLERELDWVIKRQWIESYMTRNRLSWAGSQDLADGPAVPRHPPGPRRVLQAGRQGHGRPHHRRRDHRAR
jgi:proteasome accessory factor A